jgi:transcriptional regulator with XRE-family HTH domain
MKRVALEAINRQLGLRIKFLREQNKLSQTDLCYEADIDISTLSRLERGVLNVTLSILCKIAYTLNVEVKDLFDF